VARRQAPAVLYDKDASGSIAIVTLNRPQSHNAYNVAMRDALFAALSAIADDPEVRVVILRGAGPSFCTGGDLREFGSAPSPTRAREVRWLRDVWGTLWNLRALTIASVHGHVVGGGFEMMLLCDLAVAARGTRFALPETGLAMIPGVAGTQTLPRLVGVGRALDLILTGKVLDSRSAQRLGLVSSVVADQRLGRATRALSRRLARLEPALVAGVKRMINDCWDGPLSGGTGRARRRPSGAVAEAVW
jgi:enoyl-CoA hydratase/carnithine racemase